MPATSASSTLGASWWRSWTPTITITPPDLSVPCDALAQHEEAVVTYSAIAVVLGTQKEPFEVTHQSGPTNRRTALSGGNRPFIASLVARRQVVEAVGGFDPQFDRAQDQDLIFKLLEKGPCLYISTVTAAAAITTRTCPSTSSAVPGPVTAVLAAHRARALAAGDTETVADIALGLSRARRTTPAWPSPTRWRRRNQATSEKRPIWSFGPCGAPRRKPSAPWQPSLAQAAERGRPSGRRPRGTSAPLDVDEG